MNFLSTSLLVVLAISGAEAYEFKPLSEFKDLILNQTERVALRGECGALASATSAPWMVGFDGDKCTGVLISKRHILAPAHCFHNKNILTAKFYASCNPAYKQCSGEIIEEKAIALELYPSEFLNQEAPRKHFADIALIVLEKDVESSRIKPICLAGDATKVESTVQHIYYDHETEKNGAFTKTGTKRITCPWNPEQPDYFCALAAYKTHFNEGLYIKETNGKAYLVAIGHPVVEEYPRHGRGTIVPPHHFWICEASGVCVRNKSGESLDHMVVKKTIGEPATYVRLPLE